MIENISTTELKAVLLAAGAETPAPKGREIEKFRDEKCLWIVLIES